MFAVSIHENDPVLVLRQELKRAQERTRARMDSVPNPWDDEMACRLDDECIELEALILETEPRTLSGLLAQMEQLAIWNCDGTPNRGRESVVPLIDALPERIERLAGTRLPS